MRPLINWIKVFCFCWVFLPAVVSAQNTDEDVSLQPVTLEQFNQMVRTVFKENVSVIVNPPASLDQAHVKYMRPRLRAVRRAPTASPSSGGASATNVRTKGVDEADWVKTDGRYLYGANESGIRIIDTQASGNPTKQVGVIGFGRNLRINGLYLLPGSRYLLALGVGDVAGKRETQVVWIDISNKSRPRIARQVRLTDASLKDSRRIGNRLYVVLDYYQLMFPAQVKYITATKPLSADREATEKRALRASIDQWKIQDHLPAYIVSGQGGKKVLLGDGDIYLPKGYAWDNRGAGLTIVLAVNLATNSFQFDAWASLSNISSLYASHKALYLSEPSWNSNTARTVIHKLAFRGNGLDYRGSGAIMGQLSRNALSTFQMDEDKQGNLRVVSSNPMAAQARRNPTYYPDPAQHSPVILTTLAEQSGCLVMLDRLPNKAQPKALGKLGEQLYGARLFNDFAYFVTFRRTDPLYIVDLRNPRRLRLTGELIIPGFSDYLHPLNQTLLLGVGKEADRNGRTQGVKLSLFDIRNPHQPKEINKIVLGISGSDTPASRNHHAFTSLALPNGITRVALPMSINGLNADQSGSGLGRFEINLQQHQLTAKGIYKLGHSPQWYWSENDRSIMIGNYLYYFHAGNFQASRWPQ
ncbi:MAG: hypothetical protein CR991_02430 [Proteobacteria bacterium]|nr:MAG: hypothetical protein CR991_02430 [Pseudomonadota bacterium]